MAGFNDENTPLLGVAEDSYMMRSIEESGGFQAIHISDGSIDSYSTGEDLFFDTPGFSSSELKGGCVMCRTGSPIEQFSELRPGDHIAIRGQMCCLGLCYDHHAIVTRILTREGDNTTADIIVVDVDEKRMTCVGCTCKRRTRWCWWFSCCKCKYPIREHKLSNKTWRITSEGRNDLDVSTQQIRRLDYKKRRNDNITTKNVARQFCQLADEHSTEYCFFFQNCEHCASACVNGPETAKHETLRTTLSFQSYSCFWRIVYALFWLLLALFYFINFYVYDTFKNPAIKYFDSFQDPSFKIRCFIITFLNNIVKTVCCNHTANASHIEIIRKVSCQMKIISNVSSQIELIRNECYKTDNWTVEFDTCNLKFVGIFSSLFTVIFVIALFLFYQPLYNAGFICRLCLITARMNCFSKMLAFFLIEIMGVFLEQPLYFSITITCIENSRSAYFIVMIVLLPFIGALLIYSISSIIAWVLGMCFIPSWRGAIQYTKFFKFRGLAYLIICTIRKVRKYFLKRRRRQRTGLIN